LSCHPNRVFTECTAMNQAQTILIVDDEASNIKLLRAYFQAAGYKVLVAMSGKEAVTIARNRPDLVLLDVMMPDLDGIETCRLLKIDEATKDIPVIFLSALEDAQCKTRALEAGGVDFVSKPFNGRELLARAAIHLTIRAQERQLKEYATRLEEMVQERTQQLIHAERLATLGTFAAATVHEINNPNAAISGSAELGRRYCEKAKDLLRFSNDADWVAVGQSIDRIDKSLDRIFEASHRINEISNTLRGYGRKDETQKGTCPLIDPVNDAIALVRHRLKRGYSVELRISPDLQLDCNPQKLSQVFVNLLNNAMDAMKEGEGKICVDAEACSGEIVIHVRDNGPGIPAEAAKKVFEPFFTTKDPSQGTGLGLFVVRNIVEEHQGKISLLRNGSAGATFRIQLPLVQEGRGPGRGGEEGSEI
jgi:signal transduction histidine kinase